MVEGDGGGGGTRGDHQPGPTWVAGSGGSARKSRRPLGPRGSRGSRPSRRAGRARPLCSPEIGRRRDVQSQEWGGGRRGRGAPAQAALSLRHSRAQPWPSGRSAAREAAAAAAAMEEEARRGGRRRRGARTRLGRARLRTARRFACGPRESAPRAPPGRLGSRGPAPAPAPPPGALRGADALVRWPWVHAASPNTPLPPTLQEPATREWGLDPGHRVANGRVLLPKSVFGPPQQREWEGRRVSEDGRERERVVEESKSSQLWSQVA